MKVLVPVILFIVLALIFIWLISLSHDGGSFGFGEW